MDFSDLPADPSQLRRAVLKEIVGLAGLVMADPQRWHLPGPPARGPLPVGHLHPVPELFVQFAGATTLVAPGGALPLAAGQVLVVPPRLVHQEFPAASFANLIVKCDEHRCRYHLRYRRSGGEPCITVSDELHVPEVAALGGHLDQACHWRGNSDASVPGQESCKQAIGALLGVALLDLATACGRALAGSDPEQADDPVARCRAIVSAHAGDPDLSPSGIAKHCGCTTDHLTRQMRAAEGLGLAAYLRRERLRLAARLLGRPGWSVAEAARAAGFRDPGYFSRCWRLAHGKPPGAMGEMQAATRSTAVKR
ncbi:hypothetical protein LBMAG53_27400 [Planctomycetota bacterium]|nr:hypothetical protein LBMAG53_27400 [Planctomycetota bacterium]